MTQGQTPSRPWMTVGASARANPPPTLLWSCRRPRLSFANVALASRSDPIAPHPHTGLQTVSWLFAGEIEHRDSSGVHAAVRPGELSLMTAGYGICHSEVSTPPDHDPAWRTAVGGAARGALGRPARLPTPRSRAGPARRRDYLGVPRQPGRTDLSGDDPHAAAGCRDQPRSPGPGESGLGPGFEHGILVDTGAVTMGETPLSQSDLGYLGTGLSNLTLTNATGAAARLLLLGASHSAKRSSCGGTSSAAATKRSCASARHDGTSQRSSVVSRATKAPLRGCRPRCFPTPSSLSRQPVKCAPVE